MSHVYKKGKEIFPFLDIFFGWVLDMMIAYAHAEDENLGNVASENILGHFRNARGSI